MSALKAFRASDQAASDLSIDADVIKALSLPWDAFFQNIKNDFDIANRIIDSLLTVPSRCQMTPFYVQAIVANASVFLISNTGSSDTLNVTESGACWLLGTALTCALPIDNATVGPCHAVIRYTPDSGFFITDVGSQSGTYVNRRRLQPQSRQPLRDGDMIELGDLVVEFFVDNVSLGTDAEAPYDIEWTLVEPGSYVLTAKATDDAGASTTSAEVSLTASAGSSCNSSILARTRRATSRALASPSLNTTMA